MFRPASMPKASSAPKIMAGSRSTPTSAASRHRIKYLEEIYDLRQPLPPASLHWNGEEIYEWVFGAAESDAVRFATPARVFSESRFHPRHSGGAAQRRPRNDGEGPPRLKSVDANPLAFVGELFASSGAGAQTSRRRCARRRYRGGLRNASRAPTASRNNAWDRAGRPRRGKP